MKTSKSSNRDRNKSKLLNTLKKKTIRTGIVLTMRMRMIMTMMILKEMKTKKTLMKKDMKEDKVVTLQILN